ncbi:SDR family oxidoreductase [Paenibacillus filicis]|uniref:dTDP-4-dehydrorhamnose reductase n=1 Tax=Paenibacillus gyeongsangnamensis TaxID=3388067 RepID=A0ABT4Q9P4_9BACL|nr:SDR family oxidoreductase [Paenibacillus filicis]MCZ8513600.1 SDR family oxidoreductase [Paenibacillus filicis]
MRVLVIGGSGMAGHMLLKYLAACTSYDVYYTIRERDMRLDPGMEEPGVRPHRYGAALRLDALDAVMVEELVVSIRPDVIVNCVGILNDYARQNEIMAYRINSILPHQLAGLAERTGGRLIHISTDCVFSGEKGRYEERHVPDGTSVYAKTKTLGEVVRAPHLTIRTSIVGPEIRPNGIGLLGWFLKQQGVIKGFVRVPWNGVTTLELAKFIHLAIERGPKLSGLVHLTAPRTVSKCELLQLFRQVFDKQDVIIQPDETIVLDRTLASTRTDLGYEVPDYLEMLTELRDWMRTE